MDKQTIVKIEPNPSTRSTVKIERQVNVTRGSKLQYRKDAEGKMVPITQFVEEKNLQGLPGTKKTYAQAMTKNGLKTGLDVFVDNPYADEEYYRAGWEPILKGKPKVMRQHVLEYKHNQDFDYYTNKHLTNRTTNLAHQQGRPLKFFQKPDSRIQLNQGVTVLDLSVPRDEVLYYSCLSHALIANSYEDLENTPKATHYIVNEEKKQVREAGKKRKYNQAGSRLEELYGMPEGVMIDFCKALSIKRKDLTKDKAYDEVEKYYRAKDDNLANFNYFYDLWKDMGTRAKFRAHVDLYNYLNTSGMIMHRSNKFYWNQPDPETGRVVAWSWETKEKVIEFILSPAHQAEVEILESQYKLKQTAA